jgi:AraC family transcriptional activator of pobA
MKQKHIPILTPELFREKYYHQTFKTSLSKDTDRFNINRINPNRIKYPMAAHRKTCNDFLLLTKGSTSRYKGIDKYIVTENTFFFVPIHQISGSEFLSEDAEGYYCRFELDFFSKVFTVKELFKKFTFLQFAGNPIIKIDGEKSLKPFIDILERILEVHSERCPGWEEVVCTYLLSLFFELKKFEDPDNSANKNSAIRITTEFKKALYQHFYDKQKVTDYADLLAVSPNHLNKCVKMATGKSAHELIEEMIILEAKVLLHQSSLNISDIGYKLGKTPTEFSRFFKSKTNLSPSGFREMD